MIYNIYCDETCHLEHDESNVMALGGIWLPKDRRRDINQDIKAIKKRHLFSGEAKWTKICPKHLEMYKELVHYFFDSSELHFRCLVVADKNKLDHETYNQTHDDWYYKMYFNLLKHIFSPDESYNVYIDIKDTHSTEKAAKLTDVCCNNMYDFEHSILCKIQPIRSEEVEVMQLVDIFIGAIAYNNRKFPTDHIKSSAKQSIVDLIKKRSRYQLNRSTLSRESKCNLFFWRPNYHSEVIYRADKL